MKNPIVSLILILLLLGCSEPFELKGDRDILDVVDGKISTIEGRSFIRIFQQVNDTIQNPIPDLSVTVISDKGEVFPFSFIAGSYLPQAIDFKGEVGTKYRLEAFNDDLMIASTFDSIPAPIPLKVAVVDTFLSILTPLNLIQKVDAKGANAKVSSQSVGRAKLQFEYSYINQLTNEIETTSDEDQFVLYSCENSFGCGSDSTSISVGLTIQQTWLFLNSTNPDCLTPNGDVDISNGCIAPCCLFQEDWGADFRVYLEAMSISSFEYWNQIEQLTTNNGLIFDTFPFPLNGNISCEGCQNEIVGIFRAVAETTDTENTIL